MQQLTIGLKCFAFLSMYDEEGEGNMTITSQIQNDIRANKIKIEKPYPWIKQMFPHKKNGINLLEHSFILNGVQISI